MNPIFASIPTASLRSVLVDARAEGDVHVVRLVQAELHARQPIVTAPAYIGWTATRGDYDLDDHVAHGRTEAEAVADLLDWEADQALDAAIDAEAEEAAAEAEFAADLAADR